MVKIAKKVQGPSASEPAWMSGEWWAEAQGIVTDLGVEKRLAEEKKKLADAAALAERRANLAGSKESLRKGGGRSEVQG